MKEKYQKIRILQVPTNKAAIEKVCKEFRLDINWICKVIAIETEGTYSPTIVNPETLAKGWFQFTPATCRWLNVTVPDVPQIQCEILSLYLKKMGFKPGQINSESDMYLAIFFPAAVGKPSGYALQAQGLPAYRIAEQNKAFDGNGDKVITVAEVTRYVNEY